MNNPKKFSHVTVRTIKEDGTKENKYPDSVTLEIDYDPHGLLCVIKNGKVNLLEIPIDSKTECCQLGKRSYIFAHNQEDVMLTFYSEADKRKFHSYVFKMRQGGESSVFNDRTDDSSATQYFQFYSYLSQQQNMMQDYIRTGTYQRAILSNIPDFMDKVILDVGAGSGILSFFAAQAGAKRVYAVEASSMAQHCETLVKSNNLQDIVRVIAGKIEEIELPEEVDMIISEPMGYMLYNERMLETYIHAKKWLKPGGKMFPSRGDLHVAPFYDESLYYEQLSKANFWYQNGFHGVDLRELREKALQEYLRQPIVDTFDINTCLAKSVQYSLDFTSAKETDLYNIVIPLEYHILKTSMLHGLAFWFDVAFLGSAQTVWLSTSPTEPLTHWYQVRCLFEEPILVKEGQLVKGKVQLIANRRQSYDVKLEVYVEGTNIRTSNTLDLKNPYFRYTGVAPQPPPGLSSTSPSENYWHEMDTQGAKQGGNLVNGITVNNLGGVNLDQGSSSLITLGGQNAQLGGAMAMDSSSVLPLSSSFIASHRSSPPTVCSVPSIPFSPTSTHMALHRQVQCPSLSVSSSQLQHQPQPMQQQFPIDSTLMIGDYATPGSLVLPTQGIHIGSSSMQQQQRQNRGQQNMQQQQQPLPHHYGASQRTPPHHSH